MRGNIVLHAIFVALLVAASARGVQADGEPAAPAQPAKQAAKKTPPPTAPVRFLNTWAEGRKQARERKQLILVYVTQEHPPAERCKVVDEKLFADPRAPEIPPRCVMVRLRGGEDATPEVRDFMRRYGVQGYPALYVMNADGHLVVPGMAYSVDSVLKALTYGESEEKDYATWAAKTDPEERKFLCEMLGHRMAWEELIAEIRPLADKAPTPALLDDLARAFQRTGRAAEERAELEKAVKSFPTDPDRTKRRIRLATMSLDAVADREEEFMKGSIVALVPLAGALRDEANRDGEAQVRFVLGESYAKLHQCAEAKSEFDAVVSLAPKSPTAPKALLGAAGVAWYEIDYRTCRTLCERILIEYPKSPEVKPAKATIKSCDERTKTQ